MSSISIAVAAHTTVKVQRWSEVMPGTIPRRCTRNQAAGRTLSVS
jgi:hypothetical protein